MTEPPHPVPPPAPPSAASVSTEPATSEIWEPPPPPPKARRPKPFFDRIKLLLLLVAWFSFSLWRLRQDQPAYTLTDAIIQQLRDSGWLLTLAGIELLRQIHYYISEKNARYNTFWMDRIWGAIDRWKDRRDPWLRFRTARYMKWGAAYLIFSIILSNQRGIPFVEALAAAPGAVLNFLTNGPEQMPFWINLLFPMFFIVGQFGLLLFHLVKLSPQ